MIPQTSDDLKKKMYVNLSTNLLNPLTVEFYMGLSESKWETKWHVQDKIKGKKHHNFSRVLDHVFFNIHNIQ